MGKKGEKGEGAQNPYWVFFCKTNSKRKSTHKIHIHRTHVLIDIYANYYFSSLPPAFVFTK